jgi:hypothetical protein
MEANPPSDPVKGLRGMLSHVEEGSVELQHEVKRIRARKHMSDTPRSA